MSENRANELYSSLLQKNAINQQIITKYYKYVLNNKSKLTKNKLNKQKLPKIKQTKQGSQHNSLNKQVSQDTQTFTIQPKSQIYSRSILKTSNNNSQEAFLKKKSEILTKHKLVKSNKIVINAIEQEIKTSSRSLTKKTPLKLQNIIFHNKKVTQSQISVKNQLKTNAKKRMYKYRRDLINQNQENFIFQQKRTTQRQKILQKQLIMGIKGVFYQIKIENINTRSLP